MCELLTRDAYVPTGAFAPVPWGAHWQEWGKKYNRQLQTSHEVVQHSARNIANNNVITTGTENIKKNT